ncbi:MAG TPA: tetratricopeptide repeat protein [Chthoniobacteraceae bacterium]|nr:tetratricopeptide repeat protein [Chthoniobacteraceae bacterium]
MNKRFVTLGCLALFAAVFCVFLPCLHDGFVNLDDPIYVLANPHIQHGPDGAMARWAFTTGYASNWHPLTWLSLAEDWRIFGATARGYHFVNIALHAAAAALLFLCMLQMTGAFWRSWWVAAIFGVHPLRVESVAWISERKDVLGAVFWMLALLFYIRWVKSSAPPAKGNRMPYGQYALSLLFFALGLMSKPMLVTLPFTLLLLDYWPLGRWMDRAKRSRLLVEKIPFFALSLLVCVVTYHAQQHGGALTIGTLKLDFGERIANACVAYTRYLGKFFLPMRLAAIYPLPLGGKWPVAAVAASAVYLAVITGLVIGAARRLPYLATGWFWYLGTLVPVIGLVQVGVQSMADRYTYVPSIGLAVALAWGVCEIASRSRIPKIVTGLAGVAALVVCACLTVRQAGYWKDSRTLFARTLAVTRANPLAEMNYGCALADDNELDDAIRHFQRALAFAPDLAEAHYNLGIALYNRNDFQGALDHFESALATKPSDASAHYYAGLCFAEMRKWDDAVTQFRETSQLNPDFEQAHFHLGSALARVGDIAGALGQFREALRLNPKDTSAQENIDELQAMLPGQ